MVKNDERRIAITLRRKGLSYREILQRIPVAKSTLSLWLRKIGLSKQQEQRLTRRKIEAGLRGAETQRRKRLVSTQEIKAKARAAIEDIDRKYLWLMGTMLYWAEGAKEKTGGRPTGVKFSNSDPFMIKIFVKWLVDICNVTQNRIKYELYVHESNRERLAHIRRFWAEKLGIRISLLKNIYFKKHKLITNRKNINEGYVGLLSVVVRKSTRLNREIAGWIEGINYYYWRVD